MERTSNFSFIHGWLMNPRPPRPLTPSTRVYNCLDFLKGIRSMCPFLRKVDGAGWLYKGAFRFPVFFVLVFSSLLLFLYRSNPDHLPEEAFSGNFPYVRYNKIHYDKHSTFLEQVAMLLISKKKQKLLNSDFFFCFFFNGFPLT